MKPQQCPVQGHSPGLGAAGHTTDDPGQAALSAVSLLQVLGGCCQCCLVKSLQSSSLFLQPGRSSSPRLNLCVSVLEHSQHGWLQQAGELAGSSTPRLLLPYPTRVSFLLTEAAVAGLGQK